MKKESKLKKIKKKIIQHVKLKKELYIFLSIFLFITLIIGLIINIMNYSYIEENRDFYKDVKILTYDELQKDLKDKKIVTYSTNYVLSRYLDFSDIITDTKVAANITVYKFSYKDSSFAYYVLDKLKGDSLNSSSNKENEALKELYNLEQKKGKIISLINYSIADFVSGFITFGLIIFIILVAQFVGAEVVAGKNFSAKNIDTDLSFDDIIGYSDVKNEFLEISKYIKNKNFYLENNLAVPKGILLTGEPGVGKTMFAKAFANEVNASLFFASGADFAELYVGAGARRVRSLFRTAHLTAPAIIFIDEFDAIGSREGITNDSERVSVINQLLTEMDGLGAKSDIFVIATTNYIDKIDNALLRPGRIDKKINIPNPDKATRIEILKKYLADFEVKTEIIEQIAIRTQGYSGASLKNLVDESKNIAFKRNKTKEITLSDFNEVQENSLLGLKQKIEFNSEQEKRIAFHELGHAFVSIKLNPLHIVEKVTIEPRGRALGFTMILPSEESFLFTKEEILNQISVLLAGRAAEEVFLNNTTNGCADDLQKANKLVNDMINKFGMSEKHPLIVEIHNNKLNFENDKEEISKILQAQYELSKSILIENKNNILNLSYKLIQEKKIIGDDIKKIII